MSFEVTGGGKGFLTSLADVIFGFRVKQFVFVHVVFAGGGVRAPRHGTAEGGGEGGGGGGGGGG